jgi:hypothetical protein
MLPIVMVTAQGHNRKGRKKFKGNCIVKYIYWSFPVLTVLFCPSWNLAE